MPLGAMGEETQLQQATQVSQVMRELDDSMVYWETQLQQATQVPQVMRELDESMMYWVKVQHAQALKLRARRETTLRALTVLTSRWALACSVRQHPEKPWTAKDYTDVLQKLQADIGLRALP